MPTTDFTCPACGEEVHPNAQSCKTCGTRPENGWSTGGEIIDGIGTGDLDLPLSDAEFDYDEFISQEFDSEGKHRPDHAGGTPLKKIWTVAAIVLIVAILILISIGIW